MIHMHVHLYLLTHVGTFLLGVLTYRCLHRIVFKKLDSMKQRIERIEATARCMRDEDNNA